MENLIKILEKNKYEYELGTLINNQFNILPDYFIKNSVKVKIKDKHIDKFKNRLKNDKLDLAELAINKYYAIYEVEKEKYLYIEFIVNSHILVPECLLSDFVSEDKHLYYIDTNTNNIKKTSKRRYNTIPGYYTKYFEEYLSKNYENKIGQIKTQIEEFVFDRVEEIQFIGLFNDLKSLLNMSFFRNPRFIEEINKESVSAKLITGGYNSEDVAMFYRKFGTNVLKDYSVYLLDNRTDEGLVLSKEIFANILIHDANQSLILPLHPKYGILLVPTEYYENRKKEYGDNSYMIIEDEKILHKINDYIYMQCEKYHNDVIGREEDLKGILSRIYKNKAER